MRIGIDMGHSLSGVGTGASAILSEVGKNREIGKRLIQMLQEKGHTVINCTNDYASSVDAQLAGIVAKANAQTLDVFISIHLNSGGGVGSEVYVYAKGGNAETYAKKILPELTASCDFRNRGLKVANFYVLRETSAPAVLVEVCFVDSREDADKLNVEAVAKSLFKGITGTTYSPNVVAQPAQTQTQVYDVKYLQRAINVTADGIPGPITLGACPLLTVGSTGNAVRFLQSKVGAGIDGVFGNQTKSLVATYQKRNGLVADGIVGKNTWKRLLGL